MYSSGGVCRGRCDGGGGGSGGGRGEGGGGRNDSVTNRTVVNPVVVKVLRVFTSFGMKGQYHDGVTWHSGAQLSAV